MKILLLSIISILSLISFGQNDILLPVRFDDQILNYNGFTLSYNETHEQANWVFYKLTKYDLVCEVQSKRKNNFKEDYSFLTKSSSLDDYRYSGYDRGHLKPAADESCDQDQMDETFYMTNISPQHPSFNRGIWKRLEDHVRELALENDSLYIYTGGVLVGSLDKIGVNEVSVPNNFWKVIFIYKNGVRNIICYLIPNRKCDEGIDEFIIGITELESLILIDLPD
jgi:endonuclease G, mitochondrial